MKILIAASNMVHINNFHRPYIEKFKEMGHDVYVMAKGEGADFHIPFKKRSLSFSNYRLSRRIRSILKKESFDVIYLHTSLAAFWVRMALRGVKKKPYVINTVHGYLFGKNNGWIHNKLYLFCEKLLKKQTDDIVVMNKEDYDIAVNNKLCKGQVFLTNGMGVNFKTDEVVPIKRNDGMTSLAYVGEISKRKNQIFLVRAMGYLDGYTLTLVGDGDGRNEIEKYVSKNGLTDRVFITGFTKKAYEYIAGCDIYVSASSIEGLPFNIMEAMHLNKPIVSSDIKGQNDLLPSESLYPFDDMDRYLQLVREKDVGTVVYETEKYSLSSAMEENMKIYKRPLER